MLRPSFKRFSRRGVNAKTHHVNHLSGLSAFHQLVHSLFLCSFEHGEEMVLALIVVAGRNWRAPDDFRREAVADPLHPPSGSSTTSLSLHGHRRRASTRSRSPSPKPSSSELSTCSSSGEPSAALHCIFCPPYSSWPYLRIVSVVLRTREHTASVVRTANHLRIIERCERTPRTACRSLQS